MENEFDELQAISEENHRKASKKNEKKLSKAEKKASKESKRELLEFKGVHYKKEKQLPSFEGGAHFSYDELCSILSKLIKPDAETNCETALLTKSVIKQKEVNSDAADFKCADSEENLRKSNQFNHSLRMNNLSNRQKINLSKEQNSKTSRQTKDVILAKMKFNNAESDFQNPANMKTFNEKLLSEEKEKPQSVRFIDNKTKQSNFEPEDQAISNKLYNKQSLPKKGTIKVNHKTETFELVLPKIDTGLKAAISAVKKGNFYLNKVNILDATAEKKMKLIQNNQINISTESEEKAKRYMAFNQNIVKLYKPPEKKMKSLNEIKTGLSSVQKRSLGALGNALGSLKSK